jgi:hypothetical protein
MGINTNTLLLVGGGALVLYLLTRPKTPTYTSTVPGSPGGPPIVYSAPVPTNTTVALAGDATSVLSNLFNNIF